MHKTKISMAEKSRKERCFPDLFQSLENNKVKAFLNSQKDAGVIALPVILLGARKYSFTDQKTSKEVIGVSYITTDGLPTKNNDNEVGLQINTYTRSGPEVFKAFDNLKEPPYFVVLIIKLTGKGKTMLEDIHTLETIEKLNILEGGDNSDKS